MKLCSECKSTPYGPQFNSNRYKGAGFCSAECRRKYEDRRDFFRRKRRILKWLKDEESIQETRVAHEDKAIFESLKTSKIARRYHTVSGTFWGLTDAGKKQAAFKLISNNVRLVIRVPIGDETV